MATFVRGVVRSGRIEPLEPLDVADGTQVLVAVPGEHEPDDVLWRRSTQVSLQRAWESPGDDIYDALSKR